MNDKETLYAKAEKILNNISSIKNVAKELVNEKNNGNILDDKEVYNIALTTRKLIGNYLDILKELLKYDLEAEEQESIHEVFSQTLDSLISLDESIEEVKKKNIK
jgi:Mg2+ and Co2+ transporter CorA